MTPVGADDNRTRPAVMPGPPWFASAATDSTSDSRSSSVPSITTDPSIVRAPNTIRAHATSANVIREQRRQWPFRARPSAGLQPQPRDASRAHPGKLSR